MKAKEFEQICLDRLKAEESAGRAMMVRYGVQGSFRARKPFGLGEYVDKLKTGRMTSDAIADLLAGLCEVAVTNSEGWQPMQSLPDFTGVLANRGQAFDFDCKVCGDATFSVHDEKFKKRQLSYMLRRSRMGAICFLLIHFTERKLAKSEQPAETWAFPVRDDQFWASVDAAEVKRITRQHCKDLGVAVAWDCMKGGRTERPNIVEAVRQLAEMPARGYPPIVPEMVEVVSPF